MTNSRQSTTAQQPILMLVGGGLEHGGGIGRLVGYVAKAWNRETLPRLVVIDTRGPGLIAYWPFFFVRSIFQIIWHSPRRPLVHIHLAAKFSTMRKLMLANLARLLRLDYVIHQHDPTYGDFYQSLPRWAQSLVHAMFIQARRVIVLGKPAAATTETLIGVPHDRIEIFPNAVPGPVTPRLATMIVGQKEVHVVFLGRLIRRKGVHDLIDALACDELRALSWRATLAGGGSDQRGFEEQAARAGISQRVGFPGWLDQGATKALLEAADILVLPSYAEEMAMSVLEGMAHGLCVVCTPVGALAEVVEHDVSAIVVEPGDVQGLAAALARCVADSSLRHRLGTGARQAFLQRYNIADYPQRLMAVYRRANRCDANE
jgi:glycosyltransferase involved in cell wall biosynthesis